MSDNPFSPPHASQSPNSLGHVGIHNRAFRKNKLSFKFVFSRAQMMQGLRDDAEEFINREVGAANVVSIVEHGGYDEYSVVVWYRTEQS